MDRRESLRKMMAGGAVVATTPPPPVMPVNGKRSATWQIAVPSSSGTLQVASYVVGRTLSGNVSVLIVTPSGFGNPRTRNEIVASRHVSQSWLEFLRAHNLEGNH